MAAMKSFWALGALIVAATCGSALAQPAGALKILVGFPAGGAPDAVARAYAEPLRTIVGGTVVVENRTGASGKIAIDALLGAPADGQTLALIPASALATVPMLLKSANYDAVRDFATLGSIAEYGFGISAGPASGAGDLNAFTAWAKAQSAPAGYATPGNGTPQHLFGAQLQAQLGVPLVHVPYRGGAGALVDVLGGTLPLLITTEQLLIPHEGQGKLRTLFITSRERHPRLPNVPTAREIGLAQLEVTDWFGLFVKAGTSEAKLNELRAQLSRVLASSTYRDSMKQLGYTVPERQVSDFARQLESERALWAERVRISGVQASD